MTPSPRPARRPFAALTVTLVAALGGCNDVALYEHVVPMLETFEVAPPVAIDVLFVIDDSASMSEEQDDVSQSFEAFVEHFVEADIDYHVGITTTDVEAVGGLLVGDPPWIEPGTPAGADSFREAVRVGTEGSSLEAGLQAAGAALSGPMRAGANAGFWRPEAGLVVVVVSDEDDASPEAPSGYLDRLRELQREGGGPPPVLHGLIPMGPDWGPPHCAVGDGGMAPRYLEVIEASGGVAASICEADLSAPIAEMGRQASLRPTRFDLARVPRAGTLEVRLFVPGSSSWADGIAVLPEGLDGCCAWEVGVDGLAAWIEFLDADDLPPDGTRIQVAYDAE